MLAALFLICVFVLGAHLTWNRWGDLIVDTGRELDTPLQLAEGKMLYRDVRYWYGPFAPYMNAVLYRVAGVHVRTLSTAGLISAALMIWSAYRICRLFTGRAAAAACGSAIIFANVFCQYYGYNIFNFILPYSFPATYGMLAAVGGWLALLRHIRRGRAIDFWLACAAIAVAALCKLEVIVALGITHAVFAALALFTRRFKPFYVLGYAAALLIPAAVYFYFYAQIGQRLWTDNLFITGNVTAVEFSLLHSGLQNPALAAKEIGWSLGGYFVCLLLLFAASKSARIAAGSAEAYYGVMLICSVLAAGVIFYLNPFAALRAMPAVLLFAFGVYAIRTITRRKEDDRRAFSLAILFAFALASLARILFKTGAEHYGFYLSVPAVIAFAVLWASLVPDILRKAGGDSLPAYVGAIMMLLALGATHLKATGDTARRNYGATTQWVSTSRGALPVMGLYLTTVDRAIEELSAVAKDKTLVVIPEGAGMTFLAGARNPLGVHTFTPVDFCGTYDDPAMVRRFEEVRPDYIVVNSRDVREYGKQGIGKDYGQQLMNWITANYAQVREYRSPYFALVLLKRK